MHFFKIIPPKVRPPKLLKMNDLEGARRKQLEQKNYHKCNRYFFVVIQEENIDKLYSLSHSATSDCFKALSKS